MLPILQIGPLALPVHPLTLLLAYWLALAVGSRVARRWGMDGDHIYNAGLYGLVGGLIAGRFGHVVAYWPAYRRQPLDIFLPNVAAFLWWAGAGAAVLIAAWYVRRHKLARPVVFDAAVAGLLAGLIVAELGALLAGQDIGAPAQLPWALSLWGVPRHPVQLYAAGVALIGLAAVLRTLYRSPAVQPGIAGWIGLLGLGVNFWLVEPFRANSLALLGGLRLAQVGGLVVAWMALWALRRCALRGKRP